MQIPIDTAPLKALDAPTRWLLATALDDAAHLAEMDATHIQAKDRGRGRYAEALAEAERKIEVYRQIAEAIRD